jgi:hypothetical protein
MVLVVALLARPSLSRLPELDEDAIDAILPKPSGGRDRRGEVIATGRETEQEIRVRLCYDPRTSDKMLPYVSLNSKCVGCMMYINRYFAECYPSVIIIRPRD